MIDAPTTAKALPEWLTLFEAAEVCRGTHWWLRHLLAEGKVPKALYRRKPGAKGAYLFNRELLDLWIDGNFPADFEKDAEGLQKHQKPHGISL